MHHNLNVLQLLVHGIDNMAKTPKVTVEWNWLYHAGWYLMLRISIEYVYILNACSFHEKYNHGLYNKCIVHVDMQSLI
jgi:hypothetical protein